MQCFHYVDFIRRANSPSASLPTRLLHVCLEGLETSLLMWVDAGVELETPWEEECVCVNSRTFQGVVFHHVIRRSRKNLVYREKVR